MPSFKPCIVRHSDGRRYRVYSDGSVRPIDDTGTTPMDEQAPVEADLARAVRATATRIRRNRTRRARHAAMTSLGLVRVRGALGGTYYE